MMLMFMCSEVSHAFGYLISVSQDDCRYFDDSLRWKECGYAVCGWSQRYRCSWWSRSNGGFEHWVPCCSGRHGFKCYIHCCGLQCWDQGWLKRGWCWRVPLGSYVSRLIDVLDMSMWSSYVTSIGALEGTEARRDATHWNSSILLLVWNQR